MAPLLQLISLASVPLSYAVTVTYDFNITWLTRNPDAAMDRPVIGINGQWPIPPIQANVNDTVIVNVRNQLGNQTTSLHFHGLYQNGTTEMDGTVGAGQCPIGPGDSFTYRFTVRLSSPSLNDTIQLMTIDQSTRYLLVSLTFAVAVSRWASRTPDNSRSRFSI